MTEEELLACPFCGASAESGIIDEGSEFLGGQTRHTVSCSQCGASVEGDSAEEARSKWNRRA